MEPSAYRAQVEARFVAYQEQGLLQLGPAESWGPYKLYPERLLVVRGREPDSGVVEREYYSADLLTPRLTRRAVFDRDEQYLSVEQFGESRRDEVVERVGVGVHSHVPELRLGIRHTVDSFAAMFSGKHLSVMYSPESGAINFLQFTPNMSLRRTPVHPEPTRVELARHLAAAVDGGDVTCDLQGDYHIRLRFDQAALRFQLESRLNSQVVDRIQLRPAITPAKIFEHLAPHGDLY